MNAYFMNHGIDAANIGILTAAAAIMGLLSQLAWSTLSDKVGLRRTIPFVLSIGSAGCMLIFRHTAGFTAFLFFIILFYFFQAAILPLTDAILTKSAEEQRVEFSWIRMSGTLSYAVVVYLFGRMIASNENRLFTVAAACFVILAGCIAVLPKEELPKKKIAASTSENSEEKFSGKKFLIFVAISTLVVATMNSFLYSYEGLLVLEIGKTQSSIGVANIVSSLSEVPILLIGRRLYKKYGIKMMYLAVFTACLRLILFSLSEWCGIATLYIGQAFQGVSYMVQYYCQVMYLNEHAPAGARARWFGVFGMLQSGFSALLGGLLGGRFIDSLGIFNTYRAYAYAGLAIGVVLIIYGFVLWKPKNSIGNVNNVG